MKKVRVFLRVREPRLSFLGRLEIEEPAPIIWSCLEVTVPMDCTRLGRTKLSKAARVILPEMVQADSSRA